jgi:hypothetical protein
MRRFRTRRGVIHACIKSDGTARIIDTATQTCKGGEREVTWNQTGPQGPAGPDRPGMPYNIERVYWPPVPMIADGADSRLPYGWQGGTKVTCGAYVEDPERRAALDQKVILDFTWKFTPDDPSVDWRTVEVVQSINDADYRSYGPGRDLRIRGVYWRSSHPGHLQVQVLCADLT